MRRYAAATLPAFAGFLLAWVYLGLGLNLPNWAGHLFSAGHWRLSVEAATAFALLALWGRPLGARMRWLAAAAVLLLVALRLGDLAANMLIGRPLDLSLDLVLLPSILEVLASAATPLELALAVVLVPAALAALFALNLAAIRAAERFVTGHRALFATLLGGLVALNAAGMQPFAPVAHGAFAMAGDQITKVARASSLRAEYMERLAQDPFADLPPEAVLAGLDGRNVYLIYIESYGETVLTDPRYVPVIQPALRDFEARIVGEGFHARSGLIEAPISGGQSWLAHGTMLSGLRTENNALYNLVLSSDRKSLADYFALAGYRTVSVMPAMTRSWPEGEYWGFIGHYSARNLNYAGPPFGWTSMPDQFTLDAVRRAEKRNPDRPLFIQYALVSSHGPWEPLPPLIEDWDRLGDGSLFNGHDQPQRRDITRSYVLSIEYVLRTLSDYVIRFVDDDALLIILGDHQPAPLITGEGASRAVPIHVISRDAAVLAAFEEWGFTPGLEPRPGPPQLRMEEFRDRFLGAFSFGDFDRPSF